MKRFSSLLLVFALLCSIVSPVFAGGPGDGVNAYPIVKLVQVIGHGPRGEVQTAPLPYGKDGYKIKPGMVIMAVVEWDGDESQLPSDTVVKMYAESTDGVALKSVKRVDGDAWKIEGEGRVYIFCSATAGSTKFHRLGEATAIVGQEFAPIEIVAHNYYGPSLSGGPGSAGVQIFTDQPVSGSLQMSQANGELTATFTTPLGVFQSSIPSTPMTLVTNSVEWFNSTPNSWEYGKVPDGNNIVTTGVNVGPVPASGPQSSYTVTFLYL